MNWIWLAQLKDLNPNQIVLFPESAGSASVAFHLLSPGSRPYYWQAILQSAAATNTWAMVTKKEAKLRAQRLAEVLKCPHTDVSWFIILFNNDPSESSPKLYKTKFIFFFKYHQNSNHLWTMIICLLLRVVLSHWFDCKIKCFIICWCKSDPFVISIDLGHIVRFSNKLTNLHVKVL